MAPVRFGRGGPEDRSDKAGRRWTARHVWREKKRSHTTAPRQLQGRETRDFVSTVEGFVSEVHKSRCTLAAGESEVSCVWTQGALSEEIELPVVGDRASAGILADGTGVLTRIEPRRSRLARMRVIGADRLQPIGEEQVLAANVDLALIVASVTSPPFHPRLIDRYLVLCQHGGIEPLICVNKADLPGDRPDLSLWTRVGVSVLFTSAQTGEGIVELRQRISGRASVLTGHSGVGKSSLMNALLGQSHAATAQVSASSDKGRHCTTSSCVIGLDERTFIIDTPGIRSLALWQIERDALRLYFPEFLDVPLACKFNDCLHVTEPDCAVRAGIETGDVARERYESYLRMLES